MMRIRILYILVAIAVVVTGLVLRAQMAKISFDADAKAVKQRGVDLEKFTSGAEKIKNPISTTQRGWQLIKADKPEEAEILLKRAAELDPNYRDAALYLGYAELKMVKESADGKNKIVSIKTGQEQKNKLKEAENALLAAQKLDPLYPLTNQLLGEVYKNEHRDTEAKLWYARYKEVSK